MRVLVDAVTAIALRYQLLLAFILLSGVVAGELIDNRAMQFSALIALLAIVIAVIGQSASRLERLIERDAEWYPTFGAGVPAITAAIETRLRRGEKVTVNRLGVTHEAGWPLVQDLLLRTCRGEFGSKAQLIAVLAVIDPDGLTCKSKLAPDREVVRATIRRVAAFRQSYRNELRSHKCSVDVVLYDFLPSWHGLTVNGDMAFYSLCLPANLKLAAPQGGIEVLRLHRSPAIDVRIAHVQAWFELVRKESAAGQ